MDFILNGISNVINTMSEVIGSWSFTRNLAEDLNTIKPYLDKANIIIPVDTVLTILGLYIGLQVVLAGFYWITRTINLLRGAG